MTNSATIDALTDHQAIRFLALVVDHHAPLPDPTRLRELDAPSPKLPTTTPTYGFIADPISRHPPKVILPAPPSATSPPPAPNSPPSSITP
jgi:hypothetical protein